MLTTAHNEPHAHAVPIRNATSRTLRNIVWIKCDNRNNRNKHIFSVRKFQNEVYTEVLYREFYGEIHESFRFETSPKSPTLKLPDATYFIKIQEK